MKESDRDASGWLDSLRHVGDSLLGLARNRLELFAVELQEERLRWFRRLIWVGLAAILGAAGLLVAIVTLGIWLWNAAGYLGLILLSLATLMAAAGILYSIHRQLRSEAAPFAATVAEFKKDAECLRRK